MLGDENTFLCKLHQDELKMVLALTSGWQMRYNLNRNLHYGNGGCGLENQ